jgi:hypothetical protein
MDRFLIPPRALSATVWKITVVGFRDLVNNVENIFVGQNRETN